LNKKQCITVIGGGNGAFAAASDLTINKHFEIVLCELPEFEQNIAPIRKNGGINLETLESSGLKGGFAKLYKITTDFREAISDSEIIFIIVPAFGQNKIAEKCAPYLKNGQIIILTPGSFGGSINFSIKLKQNGCKAKVIICETESMMYACRKKDPKTIWIRGYKHNLGVAVFPTKLTENVYQKLKEIYPTFIKRKNVLETSLSNVNPILHVPIMLFNLSNIDNKKEMLFYHEALTESIGKIVEKLDEERLSLNKIKGINLKPMSEIARNFYAYQGAQGEKMYELHRSNPIYSWSKLPLSLNHRYLTEDIPYGLIPMYEFANQFGCKNPIMRAMAEIGSVVIGIDFYKKARKMKDLKIDQYNEEQLISFLNEGKIYL